MFLEFFLIIAVVAIVMVIAIYIAQAIFLNKFHKLVYGKKTALAWIPLCNTYLLGKLAVNKIFGWILVIGWFLFFRVTTTINDETISYGILPDSIYSVFSTIYGLGVLVTLIYAIVKYFKLKKSKNNSEASQSVNAASVDGSVPTNDISVPSTTTPNMVSPTNMDQTMNSSFGEAPSINSDVSSFASQNLNVSSMEPTINQNAMEMSAMSNAPSNFSAVNTTNPQPVSTNNISSVTSGASVINSNDIPSGAGMETQNANPSINSIPDTPNIDMSKPVIDVFQYMNAPSQTNTSNSNESSVESLDESNIK